MILLQKYGILKTRKVAEMTNYRAILLYYSKGNTTTQIATICDCSRTTVIRAVKRAKAINLTLPVSDKIKDEELYFMLYPKRGPKKEYYRPDFYLLNKDKKKRGFTKYRAWQKYCRVAKREGYKAYGKSWFYKLYKDYFSFYTPPHVKRSENMKQIRLFTIWKESYSDVIKYSDEARARLEVEIDEWCKKRRLNKHKIWDGADYQLA